MKGRKKFWQVFTIISCFIIILISLISISKASHRPRTCPVNPGRPSCSLKSYDPDYAKLLIFFANRKQKNFNGWKQLDFDNDEKPDFYVNNRTGFEATAFRKNNLIVIAINGMVFKPDKDRKIDIFKGKDGKNAWEIFIGNFGVPFIGKIPDQFEDSIKFTEFIEKKYPDCKIIIIGKSLGGSIAQLTGAVKGYDTYTFAAPGVKYALPMFKEKYRRNIEINSRENFYYIRNYFNINDPCATYGEHVGLSYVYPPRHVKGAAMRDVHGDISHFATKKALNKLILLPDDWEYRYTGALIFTEKEKIELTKPMEIPDYLMLRYRLNRNDLTTAIKLINKDFKGKIQPVSKTAY